MKKTWSQTINWSFWIAVITLVLAALFSIISTAILSGVSWAVGMVVVFIIVFIGVFFDTIGIAATAAEETPFNAMAANKVPGGRHGVLITKHADRFASFCNDVIGDIAGIISGTASAFVVLQLTFALGENEGSVAQTIISMVFTSVVAALTVGGKSFGKTVAIYYSTPIIYHVGKVLYILETKLHIRVFPKRKKRK